MKLKKWYSIPIIILITVLMVFISFLGFQTYKFFVLETTSENGLQKSMISMSGISDGNIETYTIPNEEKYVIYHLTDAPNSNAQALFVAEKVYFLNIKAFERLDLKYVNLSGKRYEHINEGYEDLEDSKVSSLQFFTNETDNLLIYFWNENIDIEKVSYRLYSKDTKDSFESVTEETPNKILFVSYNTDNFYADYFDFYNSNGDIIYSERRAESNVSFYPQDAE